MNGRPVNPYHVLLSEAMLQQTQVATVIGYFQRFIAALPTLKALAAAQEQQVLRLWQGLGYYRRARHLHAAARAIMRDHAGQVPAALEQLLALPGIGRYTAGAIASIAHNRPAPILDGNVIRVLSRWFAIDEPVDHPATRARLWELAGALVPEASPGDFNQALMELGALVCTPRKPQCLMCPVAALCKANEQQRAETLPVKSPRQAPREVEHHVIVLRDGERYLFEQRPAKGLWSRMWQCPTAEDLPSPATPALLKDWLRDRRGVAIQSLKQLTTFTHQTTHRTIRFVIWQAVAADACASKSPDAKTGPTEDSQIDQQWRRLSDIDDLPLPNPQRRVIGLFAPPPPKGRKQRARAR